VKPQKRKKMNINKSLTKLQISCGAKHSKTNSGVEIKKMEAIQQEAEMKVTRKRKLKQ
jgi:hypothetical protein